MPETWGRLLAIGAKEPEPYRKVNLTAPEAAVGRKEGCHEKIGDDLVSSVHFRIMLTHASDEWLVRAEGREEVQPARPHAR